MELEKIREVVRGAATEAIQPTIDSVKSLQEAHEGLRKLMTEGQAPTADSVRALEEKVVEIERNLTEAHQRMVAPKTEGVSFARTFIPELDKVRAGLRAGERAIDSTLFAQGGKLNPEQADRFIDFLVEHQITLSRAQLRRMISPSGHTDELRVAARKLRKGTEGVAPALADAVSNKRRTLETVEVIWAEDLTLTFLEDNIERANAEEHIARMLATQLGNDLNDLAVNGNEADANAFININHGFLRLADLDTTDVNTFVGTGATSATKVLQGMLQALPVKFLGRPDLVYFVPVRFAQQYADEVSKRETGLGDDVLVSGFPALRYFGRPVIPEPHYPAARAMFVPTGNLFFGVQRALTIDSEWVPRKRVVEYTLTARTDVQYATGEAIVTASAIPASF